MAKRRDVPQLSDKLLSDAMELPLSERARLVEALIASFDASAAEDMEAVELAWTAEVARRVAEVDAGRVTLRPATEVFRSVREHLRARRPTRRA